MEERLDARLMEIPPRVFHGLLTTISKIDAFKGWWKGCALPTAQLRKRLEAQAVNASATACSQIAGASLPEPESATMHERKASSAGAEASREIAGYTGVLRTVLDGYEEMEFGQDLFVDLHARLLKHAPKERAHPGRYRAIPDKTATLPGRRMESVALRPSPPHLIQGELRIVTDWTVSRLNSAEFHPLLVIAGFILEFLAIRPFTDGNGRLSRILTTYLLLKCGYAHMPYTSLEKAIADRHTEYYLALRRSQLSRNSLRPDMTPWLIAFLEVLQAQAEELRFLFEARFDRGVLSWNQVGVLGLFERNDEVSNRQVCRELGIPKDTAKQVLNRLLALNLIRREGSGRAVRYRKAGSPKI